MQIFIGLYSKENELDVKNAYIDGLAEGRKELEQWKQALAEAKEIIAEQKIHCKAVDEVKEKMKCCFNCRFEEEASDFQAMLEDYLEMLEKLETPDYPDSKMIIKELKKIKVQKFIDNIQELLIKIENSK